jgi:hypothetical protein
MRALQCQRRCRGPEDVRGDWSALASDGEHSSLNSSPVGLRITSRARAVHGVVLERGWGRSWSRRCVYVWTLGCSIGWSVPSGGVRHSQLGKWLQTRRRPGGIGVSDSQYCVLIMVGARSGHAASGVRCSSTIRQTRAGCPELSESGGHPGSSGWVVSYKYPATSLHVRLDSRLAPEAGCPPARRRPEPEAVPRRRFGTGDRKDGQAYRGLLSAYRSRAEVHIRAINRGIGP